MASFKAASNSSSLIDARSIDPAKSIVVVSTGLTPFDVFNLYVTLDPSWVPVAAPPNALLLGQVRGTDGSVVLPVNLQGYPFFALQRVAGSVFGTFYASGPTNPAGAVAPGFDTTPAIGAFSVISTPKRRFKGPVLIGLNVNQTIDDTFNVYGTDDPLATPTSGSSLIGQIQGGGALTGTTVLLENYLYALVMRTGGSTPGAVISYAPGDNGAQGQWTVTDQPVSGDITPQPPFTVGPQTAQQLVDQSFVIEVDQNTPAIDLTLPNPSINSVVSQRTVVSIGTVPFTFYGKTVQPAIVSVQDCAAIAVWTTHSWVLAGNTP